MRWRGSGKGKLGAGNEPQAAQIFGRIRGDFRRKLAKRYRYTERSAFLDVPETELWHTANYVESR
jgi:hypothetical protein